MSGARPTPDLDLTQCRASLSPRALSVRYLTVLDLVAALTLGGQVLIQHILRDDQGYAHTIDLAGRQRMLAMALGPDPAARVSSRQVLSNTLEARRRTNAAFLTGDPAAGVRPGGPAHGRAWEELAPLIRDIEAAQELARPSGKTATQDQPDLPSLADRYPPAMDALVALYAEEARERSAVLQALGLVLTGLVLLLLGKGLFIFRPITRRIRSDMFNLTAPAHQMHRLSLRDGLTGVYNRTGRELKRTGDLLARFDDEEFAVVLPQAGLNGALRLAEDIRAAVKALAIPNAGSASGPLLIVSLGMATAHLARQERLETVIEAADQAFYHRAKLAGCDRVAGLPPGSFAEDWS